MSTPSSPSFPEGGNPHELADHVYERVYDQLKTLAHRVRSAHATGTLDTTGLVHEAYLKLIAGRNVPWTDRAHFFAVAARAMRQILVDQARRHLAAKRGGGEWLVSLHDSAQAPVRPEELVALDEALARLAKVDPRRAAVIEHRFFAGLSAEETAAVLGVSVATVERDWRTARAWLAASLTEPPSA